MNIHELPERVKLEVSREDLEAFAQILIESAANNQKESEGKQEILTITEAVAVTHLAKPTLYALTSKRLIPHFKRGKRILFKRTELETWMLSKKQHTVDEFDLLLTSKGRKK